MRPTCALIVASLLCSHAAIAVHRSAVWRSGNGSNALRLDLTKPSAIPLSKAEISLLTKAQSDPFAWRTVVGQDQQFAHISNNHEGDLKVAIFGTLYGAPHEAIWFGRQSGLIKIVMPVDIEKGGTTFEKVSAGLPGNAPFIPEFKDLKAYEYQRDNPNDLIAVTLAGGKLEFRKRNLGLGASGQPSFVFEKLWGRPLREDQAAKITISSQAEPPSQPVAVRYRGLTGAESDPLRILGTSGNVSNKRLREDDLLDIIGQVQGEILSIALAAGWPHMVWSDAQLQSARRNFRRDE